MQTPTGVPSVSDRTHDVFLPLFSLQCLDISAHPPAHPPAPLYVFPATPLSQVSHMHGDLLALAAGQARQMGVSDCLSPRELSGLRVRLGM